MKYQIGFSGDEATVTVTVVLPMPTTPPSIALGTNSPDIETRLRAVLSELLADQVWRRRSPDNA